MHEKPTYEELEQRVKDLEKNLGLLKGTAEIEPEVNPEDLDLKSIVKAEEIQSILDDFHYLTNMATAVLDMKGEVIESTGWQDICTKFHRVHPETAHNCTKSDLYLSKNLKPGEYVDYKCQNGLWDVVTPLYLGTKHLGNIFTGQFFYDDEDVDEEYFIKQAEKYGFDKNSYLDALRRIPRYNSDTINHLMSFLVKFTTYISKIGLTNIQLEKEITERKQAEESLKKSESQLRTLIDTIPDLVWLKDMDGVYISCNAKFERFFGAKEAEIVGKTDYDFVDWELADFFRKKDKIAMTADMPSINEEEVIYADDGHKEQLETIKMPMYDSKGRLIGVLGIARDITGRKKMELQLQQAQKMESIGNLAGGIAHDFNNLLFPIIGMSEMLLEDLPQDSLEHENVQEIFNAGMRAGDLVKQILAFSRQSKHKMTPVRIQNILKEVLKLSRSTIPSNIEIQANIDWNCGLIMADATQIHQVAMNLITNAFHAIEEKNGVIEITLKKIELKNGEIPNSLLHADQYIQLSVADNGAGMPQSIQKKIFDPYFTTKEMGKGTGLGLAVVYGIIKEHNGDIKVYSEEGKGSTFNVYLPLMKTTATPDLDNHSSMLPTGTEKILLVDDEISVAKLECQMLSRLGYQVTEQTNSFVALNEFKTNPENFDLVISDMTMSNMTGDQLAREILSIKPDMPIIICTGFSERVNKEQAEVIGVKGFLKKPVGKLAMAQMVRNVLDKAKNS